MDVKTGLLIVAQLPLFGAAIWCALHEEALLAAEDAVRRKFMRTVRAIRLARELKRREKLNRRALYTPVKPPVSGETAGDVKSA